MTVSVMLVTAALLTCVSAEPDPKPDVFEQLLAVADRMLDGPRKITAVEVSFFKPATFIEREKVDRILWSQTHKDDRTLHLVESALSSYTLRNIGNRPNGSGGLPYGVMSIHTATEKIEIYLWDEGFHIDSDLGPQRLSSWILAMVVDESSVSATKKHLDWKRFETLSGESIIEAEKRAYYRSGKTPNK